jgi:radical SAM family uncharacterized protein/radical SAM-linked protein
MASLKDLDWFDLLKGIQKPGRYTGGEWNSIRKDPSKVKARIALIFPDLYEIGMSYLGQKILYADINAHPDYAAERVFAPWPDFEERLRERNRPLCSLENQTPLSAFDILGFSLLYELNYSNVLTVLDLGGLPLKSGDRSEDCPLVMAGGPAAFNPEPVAEIFDAFLIGDGEEAILEILDLVSRHKKDGRETKRRRILEDLARVQGIYVPSLHSVAGGSVSRPVKKRVVSSLEDRAFPRDIVVPNIKTVFDRVSIEAQRGCPERCRFCQATVLYFPPRPKDPNLLVDTARKSVRSTGYEEASLAALSIGDYPYIHAVLDSLMRGFEREKVSLSLSSLRPKSLTKDIAENIVRVRKTGFTLVPEAGTERLRCVINKSLTDGEIKEAVGNAFSEGWRLIKLYFMVGLPTETEEDLEGIVETVRTIIKIGQGILNRAPQINLSLSSFIPKPHTPFQWEGMDTPDVLRDKHDFVRSRLKRYRLVKFNKVNPHASFLEAVFSRGDRRLNDVLIEAWKRGARFDSWDERLRFQAWEEAFKERDVDPSLFLKARPTGDPLPWDHIETGIPKSTLIEERRKAYGQERTRSCLERKCAECGGCSLWKGFKKRFPVTEIQEAALREPFGEKASSPRRYRVTYAKRGRIRLIGHNDTNNIIQRVLRRADVPVLYSKGFHPKMSLTFLPALPLGMGGEEEIFEFLTDHEMEEESLVARLKASAPDGLVVLAASRIPLDEAPLHRCIESYLYAVDLRDGDIQKSPLLDGFPDGAGWEERISERIEFLLRKGDFPPGLAGMELCPGDLSLEIEIKPGQGRTVRPQDVVETLFDIPHPSYALTRRKVNLKKERKT